MIAAYSVLVDRPYRNRNEQTNIGLVVLRPDGVRVHISDDLRKVKAINPRANIDALHQWADQIPQLLEGCRSIDEAAIRLEAIGRDWILDGHGTLEYASDEDYLRRIRLALDNLVRPAPRLREPRDPTSRLHLDLKRSFLINGWLGKDINAHEIVTRYPIGPEVTAEFALLNGKLNVIESVDLRSENASAKRVEVRAKALALDVARKSRQGKAACYAVMAGETSRIAGDTRELLTMYADHVFRWEDARDVNDLFDLIGKATGKPMIPLPPAM